VIYDDKMIYNSCPDCRKKVQDEPAGYRCEHCNKVHMTMIPTYMLSAKVADLSGSLYIQFPRELGDPVMGGMPAREFQEFKENAQQQGDFDAAMRVFLADKVYNRFHQILVKASSDSYSRGPDGEARFKFYAVKVYGHSLPEEDQMLLKRLRLFEKRENGAGDVDME